MQPEARHIHPDQQTRNDSYYNDNYSIPNSPAIWRFRNALWLYKYPMSVWQNGSAKAFCHKGSNTCEFFHRNTEESFSYLPLEQVFLNRIPVIMELQKFAHNLKRAQLIVTKRADDARRYDPDNFHIHQQMLQQLDAICGIDSLREEYMDIHTGHGRLLFESTSKSIDDFLHGFNWKNSVSRTTRLSYNDKQKIWQYLDKYEEQLIRTNGTISDDQSLEYLVNKLDYKCTVQQLKSLIYKYWLIDDDLIDDAIEDLQQSADGDDEYFEFEQYDTSPAANKKNSE